MMTAGGISRTWNNSNSKKKPMLNKLIWNHLLRCRIDDMELSVRPSNCLRNNKIYYIGDLIQKTENDLLSIKNFGQESLAEIKYELEKYGLTLSTPLEDWPPVDLEKHSPIVEEQGLEEQAWQHRSLTLDQYREILFQKQLHKIRLTRRQLAAKFGVKPGVISTAMRKGISKYDKLLENDNAE
jgi:hypothetical protein